MGKSNRNYGIDLLRIVSMLGVITLHILGHGGALSSDAGEVHYALGWLLELLCYPAVNCFVLISGFVGYRQARYYPRLRNLFTLLFTVLFYSVSLTVLLKVIYPAKIGMMDLISAFLPVLTSRYWFFTAYFAMFLISPMLNFFVHRADGKMIRLVVAAFLYLGLASRAGDAFYLIGGYSFVWLSFVYMAGAAAKKYDIPGKFSAKFWGLGYLLCIGITWLVLLVFRWIPLSIPGIPLEKLGKVLISYCSPTIFTAAVCALGLFTRVRTKTSFNRVIAFFSGSAFSVYLIHDNIHVRKLLMAGRFAPLAQGNVPVLLSVVIAAALGIYLVCSLADQLRAGLFALLRLETLAEKLEKLIKQLVGKFAAGR